MQIIYTPRLMYDVTENIDNRAEQQGVTHYRFLLVLRNLRRKLEVSGHSHVLNDRQQWLQAIILRNVRAASATIVTHRSDQRYELHTQNLMKSRYINSNCVDYLR